MGADQFDDVVAFVDTDIKKHGECIVGNGMWAGLFGQLVIKPQKL